MDLYPVAVCYNVKQRNKIQYGTTQYGTVQIKQNKTIQ